MFACAAAPGCGPARPPSELENGQSSAAGARTWSLALGNPGHASIRAVASTGALIAVAGGFDGSLQRSAPQALPAAPGSSGRSGASLRSLSFRSIQSSGSSDGFVMALDPAGQTLWTRALGGLGHDTVSAVAAHGSTPDATVVTVALSFGAAVDLGEQRLDPVHGESSEEPSTALLSFDGSGRLVRAELLRHTEHVHVHALGHDSDGALMVAGSFAGTMRLGDHVLTSAGASDAFVARIAPTGAVAWVVRAGGAGPDAGNAVTAIGDAVVLGGLFSGEAGFASQTLDAPPRNRRQAGQNGFVAALDRRNGAFRWVVPVTGPASAVTAVAVAPGTDRIVCAGTFEELAGVGKETLVGRGQNDGFVTALAASGQPVFARVLGGPGSDLATALVRADATWLVAGTFEDELEAGEHSARSAGKRDVFFADVRDDGTITSVHAQGDADHDDLGAVVALPDGSLVVAGSFAGRATLTRRAPSPRPGNPE